MKLIKKILVFLLLCPPLFSQTSNLYDSGNINEFNIKFDNPAWDSILSDYYTTGNKRRLEASIEINGTYIDSVGVRYKGYSSYRTSYLKKPLNVELNYSTEQDYQLYKTLKLSNGFRDPSLLREVLSYEIARKYMPASRANFAEVYINNEYYGLFSSVQSVDKYFLRTHFGSDEGIFVKGAPELGEGGLFLIGKSDLKYRGEDSSDYMDSYELRSGNGWSEVIELFKALSDVNSNIDQYMNVDGVLWLLAFHNLLVSLDSPVNAPRNFYLYKNNTGLFELIIWDLNMSFGTYQILAGSRSRIEFQDFVHLDPFHNTNNDDYPLMKKFLNVPRYRRMYIAHMKTILEEIFISGWYIERGRELQQQISHAAFRDKNKFYTMDEFWENFETTLGGGSVFIPGIVDLMSQRTNYLINNTDLAVEQPEITDIEYSPQPVNPYSEIAVSANVSLADRVFLFYRNSINEVFEEIEMFDDGSHGDGGAGDGVYGALINTGAGELQYYFYAEHEYAGKFAPERAANEYYTFGIAGDIVINEFIASNDTTNADESGEYDDWIELYNNTDSSMSLNGYYLSDKTDNLTKWELPDTAIAPHGYFVIWADEDSSQGSLHANFKLSAEGENIYLVDSYGRIADHINFGAQSADISTGRYPNGTGPLIQMLPTPALENKDILNHEAIDLELPDKYFLSQNYPNPFNPITTIEYSIPDPEALHGISLPGISPDSYSVKVQLMVYDILGRRIEILVDHSQSPGNYTVQFNGSKYASGVYFYSLRANDYYETKKMLMIK